MLSINQSSANTRYEHLHYACSKEEAQLLQRDRAMLHAEYFIYISLKVT